VRDSSSKARLWFCSDRAKALMPGTKFFTDRVPRKVVDLHVRHRRNASAPWPARFTRIASGTCGRREDLSALQSWAWIRVRVSRRPRTPFRSRRGSGGSSACPPCGSRCKIRNCTRRSRAAHRTSAAALRQGSSRVPSSTRHTPACRRPRPEKPRPAAHDLPQSRRHVLGLVSLPGPNDLLNFRSGPGARQSLFRNEGPLSYWPSNCVSPRISARRRHILSAENGDNRLK